MRPDLCKDPKTVLIADYLAEQREFMDWLSDPVQRRCDESAYEHVTRNVTVALCVTALLVTWGIARDRGDRDGDDLVLDKCRLNTLDELSGIPCFGDAMASVGWAIDGPGETVRFPKFFKENESPDDRHRRQNAERQARFREKRGKEKGVTGALLSNVTNNAEVTHREEKRRKPPIVPQGGLNGASFDAFWKAYPRHTAKVVAERVWSKIKPDHALLAKILDAIERQSKSEQWTKDGGAFIPHPATWLNQRRWEDDLLAPAPQGPRW